MQALVSAMIARRISSTGPPVDRSIMASAPAATATRAFSSSLSMLVSSLLVPMLALTLVRRPLPTASGVPLMCLTFWQMMAVPAAMRWRRTSGSIPSVEAACIILSVTMP
jgi:hypothetical protein